MKMLILQMVLVVVLTTAFATGCRRRPREDQFRYSLEGLDKTDPAMVVGREVTRLPLTVPRPRAMALDSADRLYVAGSNRLDVLTLEGDVLDSRPLPGSATCLHVDESGTLLVGLRTHLLVIASDNDDVRTWKPYNAKSHLTSVAATSENVFVADAGNRIVLCYDRTGRLVRSIGVKDKEAGIPGFVIPSPYFDLAVEREDSLWVVNPGRHLLANYHPDGTRRASWGKSSMKPEGFCGCCNPTHFALLRDGGFVTSEKGLPRIKRYAPDGEFLGVIAGPEQFTEHTEGLDLAVDMQGRVLALDPQAAHVRIYDLQAATNSR